MKKNILIVDDEPAVCNALKKFLTKKGYNVIVASDGAEGLEKARNSNPDLILLDVLMPKMDGYEVCRLLKFDAKYKSIPIIIITAKTEDVDREMGKKVGANDYITKPFETEELINKIKSYLSE